jgi:hypothetical protein
MSWIASAGPAGSTTPSGDLKDGSALAAMASRPEHRASDSNEMQFWVQISLIQPDGWLNHAG